MVVILAFIMGCSSDDKIIDKVFNNTTSGAALRTIDLISGEIDNDNMQEARFAVLLEIQDAQNGNLTEEVQLYVTFIDNNDQGNSTEEILFRIYTPNDFTPGIRELPYLNVNIPLSELKTFFSLTDDEVVTCDQFIFRFAIKLKDGRVFSRDNSSNNVLGGSYFQSPFTYTTNVVGGPLPDDLSGTHTFTTTDMFRPGADPCGGTVTGSVTWTATATPGTYATSDFSFGMFESSCWFDDPATSGNARVKWFCRTLTPEGNDQYGESWEYTIISIQGPDMVIEFLSTYNEGGRATITRAGGIDWPAIMQD